MGSVYNVYDKERYVSYVVAESLGEACEEMLRQIVSGWIASYDEGEHRTPALAELRAELAPIDAAGGFRRSAEEAADPEACVHVQWWVAHPDRPSEFMYRARPSRMSVREALAVIEDMADGEPTTSMIYPLRGGHTMHERADRLERMVVTAVRDQRDRATAAMRKSTPGDR